jgi:hemoglobin
MNQVTTDDFQSRTSADFDPIAIDRMVDDFYEKISAHERLGPIFLSRNQGDWLPHLAKMKLFWRSVLLKSGEYKGSPPQIHMAIKELESTDFAEWLNLFEKSSEKCFPMEQANIVNQFAKRIARSLWLSCFGTPLNSPPF